jgi:hypothetical protein
MAPHVYDLPADTVIAVLAELLLMASPLAG